MARAGRQIRRSRRQESELQPAFRRTRVAYAGKESPGTVVVDPEAHYLYYVEEGGQAMRYGVGVGREGFAWSGEATIHNKQEWPDWYPPKEMLERRPELLKQMSQLQSGTGMPGGPDNPLGARAHYLWHQGTRTPISASTAPTSRRPSARAYPRAASAWSIRT